MSHKELVDRHRAAILAGDYDALMATYAEDAAIVSAMANAVGHEAIRGWYEYTPEGTFNGFQEVQSAEHDNVYVLIWKTDGMPFSTDTFVIENGKILRQTVAISTFS